MKQVLFLFSIFFVCMLANTACSAQKPATAVVNPDIWVRKNFKLEVVQSDLKNPRFMLLNDAGTLFVSFPEKGEIKALRDADGDGYYETVVNFISGHKKVHAMQWVDGWLWYAETGAIFKSRDTNNDGVADETITVIADGKLPKEGGHWWRSLLISNNRIYTSIGCSGNIDDDTETERLKIWSFALDGSDKKLFCGGLRNTEKLVVRPGTSEIWGMDHGSDWFGGVMEKKLGDGLQPITDNNPPCEMNKYVEGGYYGHPYITGNKLPRYEYMDRPDIVKLAAKTIIPEWSTGAHWAPNAMCFYTGSKFPSTYLNDAIVAYHGSWNRSEKGGYQISHVMFEDGKPYGEQALVKFLDKSSDLLGRPVDVVNDNKGGILISDDWGGKIYRLTYKE